MRKVVVDSAQTSTRQLGMAAMLAKACLRVWDNRAEQTHRHFVGDGNANAEAMCFLCDDGVEERRLGCAPNAKHVGLVVPIAHLMRDMVERVHVDKRR